MSLWGHLHWGLWDYGMSPWWAGHPGITSADIGNAAWAAINADIGNAAWAAMSADIGNAAWAAIPCCRRITSQSVVNSNLVLI